MKTSFVVCTRNRCRKLRVMLAKIEQITPPSDWEMIVVNNGSTDDTEAVVKSFIRKTGLPLMLVNEPNPGSGRARNAGVQACSGEIVVCTDDDCYPAEDFLLRAAEIFQEEEVGFAGGRVLLYDPSDYPITIQERAEYARIRPGEFIPAGFIHGANMAFRRSAFESVNGFDVRLGAGTPFAAEDVDIMARISAKGWVGIYDPAMLVYHHHGRKTVAEARALDKFYDIGRGAYFVRCLLNPSLRNVYARNWYWSMRNEPLRRTFREITGGAKYLGSCVLDTLL